jgi:hypothetical protein
VARRREHFWIGTHGGMPASQIAEGPYDGYQMDSKLAWIWFHTELRSEAYCPIPPRDRLASTASSCRLTR